MAVGPKPAPSLNSPLDAADKNERRERECKVEEAMRSLPLKDKSQVSSFVSLFEMTYDQESGRKDRQPARPAVIEQQLADLLRKCDALADHLKAMHGDAIRVWAAGGLVTEPSAIIINLGTLLLSVETAAGWAEVALAARKKIRRAPKLGRPPDAIAAAMYETAAFVYTKLTGKRPGRAYDAYKHKDTDTAFSRFLRRIYEAYGIGASARARARTRRLRRHMGNNPKK